MIGRFVKTTLADWKGRDCCRIEFRGYDVRYPYLGGSDIYDREGPCIDPDEILSYIRERGQTLDGIVLGGGEPLAHEGLYGFLKELRRTKRPIMLETQGMRPDVLDDLAGAMMFDMVRLYVPAYPGSPNFQKATGGFGDPALMKRSMEIVNGLDVDREFFVYAVPGIVDGPEIENIARSVGEKTYLTISQFDPRLAMDPEYRKIRPYSKTEGSALSASAKRYAKRTALKGF